MLATLSSNSLKLQIIRNYRTLGQQRSRSFGASRDYNFIEVQPSTSPNDPVSGPKDDIGSKGDDFTLNADLDLDRLKQSTFIYQDRFGFLPRTILKNSLNEYVPTKYSFKDWNWLQLGHQHAYLRPPLGKSRLCLDGTDDKFLPGPPSIWQWRLWAGGSVAYNVTPKRTRLGTHVLCVMERASDVRVVSEKGQAKKVFVTVERKFAVLHESAPSPLPINTLLAEFQSFPEKRDTKFHFMTETENICFLRDKPTHLQDERTIRPPSDPHFIHTMIPTRSLLFQFSALTYNAHSIHLDSKFAQDFYNAKDIIVHGPLTMVLMVEFLVHRLAGIQSSRSNVAGMPVNITYTNLQPLYVDEPIKLCCKPARASDGQDLEEVKMWQVWIEKGEGEHASCAVKATVEVVMVNKSQNAHFHAPQFIHEPQQSTIDRAEEKLYTIQKTFTKQQLKDMSQDETELGKRQSSSAELDPRIRYHRTTSPRQKSELRPRFG